MSNATAAEGNVFICLACGKTSNTKYGLDRNKTQGWDESCMLNSDEFPISGIKVPSDWQPWQHVLRVEK